MAGRRPSNIITVLNLVFLLVYSVHTTNHAGREYKLGDDKTLGSNSTEIDIMEYADVDEATHIRPVREVITFSVILFIISGSLALYALMDAYPNILMMPRIWFALFLNRTVNIEPIQKLWADIRRDLLSDKSPTDRERVQYILSTLRAIIHEHFDVTRSKMRDIVRSIQIILLLHNRVWNKYVRPALMTVYKRIREVLASLWEMITTECLPRLKSYRGVIWKYFKQIINSLNLAHMIPIIPTSVYNSFVSLMNMMWELSSDIARDIHEVIETIGEFKSALINRVNFQLENLDQFVKYMMGEADTFDYNPAPYIRSMMRSIRRKIVRFMKFLRHRINIVRKKINDKVRPIITWGRTLPKKIREKYRKLHKAWHDFLDGMSRWRKAKWSWFRKISNYIYNILKKIHDYFAHFESRVYNWIQEMYAYIKYRLSRWIPYWRQNIVNRFKYYMSQLWRAILSYMKQLSQLVKYFNRIVSDFVKSINPLRILKSIIERLRRAIDALIKILKTVLVGFLIWGKKASRFIQTSLRNIMDSVALVIKTVASIKETITSTTRAIIRAVYNMVRYIMVFFRIKKLDKWRYIASGVYYVLYIAHQLFYWVKDLMQIPFDVWQWMVERITFFKEWLKEQMFLKPGLFYFIGDIMRSVQENKTITGWLANIIGRVKLLRWIVHDGKLLKDILSDWLSDTFVKQWIRTHVFRPTTTSTTTTRVPDLRPYFQRNTILGSIRMAGCCSLPNHPLDEKMARQIGTYLYELFNGELEE